LLLALTCGCNPFVWLQVVLVLGGRQAAHLHENLKPGMSVAEVLAQVDGVRPSQFGLSRVFAQPRATVSAPAPTDSSPACPEEQFLVWGPDGPPWGRRAVPAKEEVARRLASCDAIEFRLVVIFTRLNFEVKLKEGRVTEVTLLSQELT
jgi:hypothetical protein